jgi:hypothetical protein
MLLMVAVLGLAIFGVVRLGQTLSPRERVVLVVTFILGLALLVSWLIRTGVLGRATDGS